MTQTKHQFESKEDFLQYITDNAEEVNQQTTARLNKMFYIPGYRISKVTDKNSGNKSIALKVDRYLTAEKLRKHEVIVGEQVYDIEQH
jgi:hypothetical protein